MQAHKKIYVRRCTYVHCERPEESSQFSPIKKGSTAGGQDWSSLTGSVLCLSCYTQFYRKGRLERSQPKPLDASAKRCSYAKCGNPEKSVRFNQICERSKAGGQDWSSLAGTVLCNACWQTFKNKGTLERSKNTALEVSERRCTYTDCPGPEKGTSFMKIHAGKTSGGRDWSSIVGNVLCNACYVTFVSTGSLERTKKILAASDRRCTYAECENPIDSSSFHQISKCRKSGGQDWSSLEGSVLCNACYVIFNKEGRLKRSTIDWFRSKKSKLS
jgi:hypothetical protein